MSRRRPPRTPQLAQPDEDAIALARERQIAAEEERKAAAARAAARDAQLAEDKLFPTPRECLRMELRRQQIEGRRRG